MDTFRQDLRFGLRGLCKYPGALGIGANTAMFSAFHKVLFARLRR